MTQDKKGIFLICSLLGCASSFMIEATSSRRRVIACGWRTRRRLFQYMLMSNVHALVLKEKLTTSRRDSTQWYHVLQAAH